MRVVLLDGHPRNITWARALDGLLRGHSIPLDAVLLHRISEEEEERRVQDLAARRSCRNDPLALLHRAVDNRELTTAGSLQRRPPLAPAPGRQPPRSAAVPSAACTSPGPEEVICSAPALRAGSVPR